MSCPTSRPPRCTGPLRAAKLMGRQAHHIDAQETEIDRDLTHSLDSVSVNQGTMPMGHRHDVAHRFDDAGLIVGEHYADQRPGTGRQQMVKHKEINDALAIHGKDRHRHVGGLCGFQQRRDHRHGDDVGNEGARRNF